MHGCFVVVGKARRGPQLQHEESSSRLSHWCSVVTRKLRYFGMPEDVDLSRLFLRKSIILFLVARASISRPLRRRNSFPLNDFYPRVLYKLVEVQEDRLLLFRVGTHDPNGNGRDFILAEQNSVRDMRIVRV